MKQEVTRKVTLLSVTVDPIPIAELNRRISTAVANHQQLIIANHNLHSIYLYHRDPKMRALYERAQIVHIDSMPLIYWARIVGYSLHPDQRVTYVDWIHPLLAMAARENWRVFYLGGRPGVAELAAARIRQQYSGLQLATHHGYFDPRDNPSVLTKISAFSPQILMVGMGMPKQEHWILDNLNDLTVNAILTAGACFDYIAGVIPTPPRWMGQIGLEWLYRLISEPRRLASRYILEPWFLLPLAIKDFRMRKDLVHRFRKIPLE